LMEVNVGAQGRGKAGEREDGAVCKGWGAVIASTTGVSAAPPGQHGPFTAADLQDRRET